MRRVARLPRRLRLGWRDLDVAFLRFLALSLVAHALIGVAGMTDRAAPSGAPSPFMPVGFVLRATDPPLPEPWPYQQGVLEILGSPAGGSAVVGDLLAGGGIDEDLTAVLSRVDGVRLPRPGERTALRAPPPRPHRGDPGAGCSYDADGGVFCACF